MTNQVSMREWTVLTFIRAYWQTHKISPSVIDVTDGCALRNRYVAYRLLKKLAKKGLLSMAARANGNAVLYCARLRWR